MVSPQFGAQLHPGDLRPPWSQSRHLPHNCKCPSAALGIVCPVKEACSLVRACAAVPLGSQALLISRVHLSTTPRPECLLRSPRQASEMAPFAESCQWSHKLIDIEGHLSQDVWKSVFRAFWPGIPWYTTVALANHCCWPAGDELQGGFYTFWGL